MTKRKFFSGNSVRQAVVAAASHFELPVDEIAYQEVEKKHGFLKMRKRVIIEVDEDNPRRPPSGAPHPQRQPDEPARAGESAPRGSSRRVGAAGLDDLPGKPPVGQAPPDDEADEEDEEVYDAGEGEGEDDDLGDDEYDDFDDDDDDEEDDDEDDDEEDDEEEDDEEDDEDGEEAEPAAPRRGGGRGRADRGRGAAARQGRGRGAEEPGEEPQPDLGRSADAGLYDEDDDNRGNRMVPGEKPPHEKRGVWSGQPLEPARGAGRGSGRSTGSGSGRGRGGERGSSRGRKPAKSRSGEAERSPARERGAGAEAERSPARGRGAEAERAPAGEAERGGGRRSGRGRRRDRGRGGRGGDLVEIPARSERASGPREEASGEEADACRKALEQILRVAGIEVEAKIYGSGERYDVELSGKDEALLTAEGGELLRSVQHLLPRAIRGVLGRSLNVRVDCSDFREIHEERLRSLAQEMAGQVRRSGRAKKLDPMPPADRRIIHLTLADEPDVTSSSEGRGHYKQVVVRPD